jgi:hypothetical protein
VRRPGYPGPSSLPLPVISATYLSGVTLPLLLPRAQIAAVVAAAAEKLAPHRRPRLMADFAGGAWHPLLIDVWQLQQGRLELAGLTQHEWAELGYGTLGGAANGALGALRGLRAALDSSSSEHRQTRPSLPSPLSAALRGGLEGLASGAGAFRRVGRALSEHSAYNLGNYAEVMFSIPNVRIAPDSGSFALSLGVYTDSHSACAIDRFFRYGLGKTLAAIQLNRSERSQLIRVIDPAGREVLSATIRTSEPLSRLPAEMTGWFDAPLLGIHSRGEAAVLRWSCMRRHFDAVGLCNVDGELTLPMAPFGLPSGGWRLSTQCVAYERVWSEITLPATLS